VSECKGDPNDNSARLQLSEANVAVYSFGEYAEYQVGIDGFIKVRYQPIWCCAHPMRVQGATIVRGVQSCGM
jgi:hypothetical protein